MNNTAFPVSPIHQCFEDFLFDALGANNNPLSFVGVGSGGGGVGGTLESAAPVDNSYSGLITLTTGTSNNNNSKASLNSSNSDNRIKAGGGIQSIEWRIRLPNLSGSPEYNVKVGLQDGVVAGDPANGIYLQYSDTINSGNWRGVTRNSSTSTNVNSSITVAANTWYKLKFIVNTAGNEVQFFVNDVYIGSSTTNIPTGNGMRIVASIEKSGTASATARTMHLDWTLYRIDR